MEPILYTATKGPFKVSEENGLQEGPRGVLKACQQYNSSLISVIILLRVAIKVGINWAKRFPLMWQKDILSRTVKGLRFLPYLQADKLAYHMLWILPKNMRHPGQRKRTVLFIAQQAIIFESVPIGMMQSSPCGCYMCIDLWNLELSKPNIL